MKEIWKPIIDGRLHKKVCEEILVSNKGRVKSTLSGKEILLTINKKGIATITHYGKRYNINIKHQVYINFIGELKNNEVVIALDGNNQNPSVSNLKKMTKSEFMKYCSKKVSPLKRKEASIKASITNFIPILGQIELYEKLTKQKLSEYEIAKRLGVSRDKIRNFRNSKKVIAGKLYKKGYFTEANFKEFKNRYKKEYIKVERKIRFFTQEDTQIIEYLQFKINQTNNPAVKRELEEDLKRLLNGEIL